MKKGKLSILKKLGEKLRKCCNAYCCNRPQKGATLGEAGFTLAEMMIVLAIIALVGTFVTTNVIRRFDEAKVSATKTQIKQIGVVLDDFRRVCGRYPTTEENLDALVKAPASLNCKNYDPEGFIRKVPQDAWSRDFVYVSDGRKYTLKSLGANGVEGGEGIDKDISSDDE